MCRAIAEGGRRCPGYEQWRVNREGAASFAPDTALERHMHRPPELLSMSVDAVRQRRFRANRWSAEVAAIRTVHGVEPDTAIGPVLRRELWAHRAGGDAASLLLLAERFEAVAASEGVSAAEVAARYENEQVRPHRQVAGERLAALAVPEADRPEWADPDHLVRMIEPPDNGVLGDAYVRVVKDLNGAEFVLVTSHDGSEPMTWAHDEAGLYAAMDEALDRVRAAQGRDRGDDVDREWVSPYVQTMSEGAFLSHVDSMHLTHGGTR